MNKPTSLYSGSDIDQASAVLTVDLGAIRENYRRLRVFAGDAECSGVVKADAYGLGAVEVAAALRREGCSTFFVAHVPEGVALRMALGSEPAIHVLNGIHPGDEQACMRAGLIPVVNSALQLAAWQATAQRAGRGLPVTLHVDTGMARLGMPTMEVERLGLTAFDGLDLKLVMSHLACADEPGHAANEKQRELFEALRRNLPPAPLSFANSSGIFLGPAFQLDVVRPGVALYGVNPTPGQANPMLQAIRLDAKVLQTRVLDAGGTVGYGQTFRTEKPLRTVTIAIGYADGWPRRASGAAFWRGTRLPFIGRVSMDSIVVDASGLPQGDEPGPGDFVEVIGASQTVDDVADLSGTIGYEILTGLGRRFHRRYIGG